MGSAISEKDMAIGNMMSAVAVLLIHMLRIAELKSIERTLCRALNPIAFTMRLAIKVWIPYFSKAMANINPPRKRKMMGLAYLLDTSSILINPVIGKYSMGTRAVTPIDTVP